MFSRKKDSEDEKIIKGFIDGENKVISYIYKTFFPVIEKMILKFDGTKEDACDIFQDSLILMYQNLKEKKVNISKHCFGSVLFTIARSKQLDLLRHKNTATVINNDIKKEKDISEDVSVLFDEIEKDMLFEKHFNKLSHECQEVLKYSLQNIPLKEITRLMNFKTDDYTKHRRYKCKEYLMNSIINDPKYGELKYD